jgi:hypothetical protein
MAWRSKVAGVPMAQRNRSPSLKSAPLHAFVFAGVCLAASTASAAQLAFPSDHKLDLSINEPRSNQPSWLPRDSDPGLLGARSLSDVLGKRFDLPNGQVQLFRFRPDSIPTTSTVPQRQIEAGGIRLKWNW